MDKDETAYRNDNNNLTFLLRIYTENCDDIIIY